MITPSRRQFCSSLTASVVPLTEQTKATASDATTFQYDYQRSGYEPEASPPRSGLGLKWKRNFGDDRLTTPAITKNAIYVGDEGGALYSVDRNGGASRWRWTDGDQVATPTVDKNTLYVSTGDTIVTAFDATDGTVLWRHTPQTFRPDVAAPIVLENSIYAGSKDGSVYAFDKATGDVRWQFETDNHFWGPIATDGRRIYCGNTAGNVYALAVDTGDLIWQSKLHWITGGITLVDETVYAMDYSGRLGAYDLATGDEKWTSESDDGIVWSAPAATGDIIVYGEQDKTFDSAGYQVYAVDAVDGSRRWTQSFDNPIQSSLVIAGDTTLFATGGGTVHALDLATGDQRWKRPIHEDVWATPVVLDETIYVGGANGTLYAFEERQFPSAPDIGLGGGLLALLVGGAYAAWRSRTDS